MKKLKAAFIVINKEDVTKIFIIKIHLNFII